MLDKKRYEYEQYMNYRAKKLKKLKKHQQLIEINKKKLQDLSLEQSLFEEIKNINQTKTEQILAHMSKISSRKYSEIRKNTTDYLNYLQRRRKVLSKVSI